MPMNPQQRAPPSKVTQEMSAVQPNSSVKRPTSSEKSRDKYSWMARMKHKLPPLLCDKNQYFLTCFNTDQQECEKLTTVYLSACLDKSIADLPSRLTSEQQVHWGEVMGRCTYDLYNTFMADLKKDTPACTKAAAEQPEAQTPAKAVPPKKADTE